VLLQQVASTHLPLAQLAGVAQVEPLVNWQFPLPSQVVEHESGSCCPLGVLEQVPLPLRLHAWHFAHDAEPQQTLSTQLPVPQRSAAEIEQAAPLGSRQTPLPSQVVEHESGSCCPFGILAQVPAPLMLQA